MAKPGPQGSTCLDWEENSDNRRISDTAALENQEYSYETQEPIEDDEDYDVYCHIRADFGSDWEILFDEQYGIDFEYSQHDLKTTMLADRNLDEYQDSDLALREPAPSSLASLKEKNDTEIAAYSASSFKSEKSMAVATFEENAIQHGFDIHPGLVQTMKPLFRLPEIRQWVTNPDICALFRRHLNLNNDRLLQAACLNCAFDQIDYGDLTGSKFLHEANGAVAALPYPAKRSKLGSTKLREVETVELTGLEMENRMKNSDGHSKDRGLLLGYNSRMHATKTVTYLARTSGPRVKEREESRPRTISDGQKLERSNHEQNKASFMAKCSKIPRQTAHPRGATLRAYRPTIRGSRHSVSSKNPAMKVLSKEEEVVHLGDNFPKQLSTTNSKMTSHSPVFIDGENFSANLRSTAVKSTTDDRKSSRITKAHPQPALITQDTIGKMGSSDPVSFLLGLTHHLEAVNKCMAVQLKQYDHAEGRVPQLC